MKVELTLQELLFAIFPVYDDALHSARVAYSHFTTEHHTGLARQVVSEHLAKSVIALDPDELFTHIQIYNLPNHPPFHVLWLKDEWLTSTERRKLQLSARLRRVEETEAKDLEARWLRDLAKSMNGALALPLDACVAKVQLSWKQHNDPRRMMAWVHNIEELFSCKFWVEPPQGLTVNNNNNNKVTHEEDNGQNPIPHPAQDQADSRADQEVEQAERGA